MRNPVHLAWAKSYELGCGLVHSSPRERQIRLARWFMKLDIGTPGSPDRVLRWRVDQDGKSPDTDAYWAHADFPPDKTASRYVPDDWVNKILVTPKGALDPYLTKNYPGVPAVAYRFAGKVAMIGISELYPNGDTQQNFLLSVDSTGKPSRYGHYYGVVMRVGPDGLDAVIGVATHEGTQIETVKTFVGSYNVNGGVPKGLYRV